MPEPRSRNARPLTAATWLLASVGGALAGCKPETTNAEFPVVIEAESDPGQPLANVGIVLQGRELGRTEADGSLRLRLQGEPGEKHTLSIACPPDYAAPSKPLSVALRPLIEEGSVPRYRAQCSPVMRSLVVAVRAKNGADLPLLYQGREIARTDADGVAHALVRVPPAEHLAFVLDTSAPDKTQLQPYSPELTKIMPAHDDIVVFDKAFTKLEPKPVRTGKRRVVGGPTPIPFPH
jgi:hypothetical protein